MLNSSTCFIQISSNPSNKTLNMKVFCKDLFDFSESYQTYNNSIDMDSFFLWMICNSKRVLEQENIPSDIVVETKDIVLQNEEKMMNAITRIGKILNNTLCKINETQLNYDPKQQARTLFYNISNSSGIIQLYNKFQQNSPDKNLLINLNSGFDVNTRDWKKSEYPSFNEIMSTLNKHHINNIISINFYLLQHLLDSENILLLPILAHCNIHYSIIDFDLYDHNQHAYWLKPALNHNTFNRFSIFPSLSSYFDKELKLDNVRYYNFLDAPQSPFDAPRLNDEYNLLILSNSRLERTIHSVPVCLYIMSFLDEENLFSDLQYFYHGLNSLIQTSTQLCIQQKMNICSQLASLYLNLLSFVKYEAIEGIKSNRRIFIYGDSGWNILFDEYYQKEFLKTDQVNALLNSGQYLQLLFNQNVSPLESNFSFQKAISGKCAYLNFSAMVHSEQFSSLKNVEYKNIYELNEKIESIPKLLTDTSYTQDLNHLKKIITKCNANLLDQLQNKTDHNLHDELQYDLKILYHQNLQQYIKSNATRMTKCLSGLFNSDYLNFNLHSSAYFNRPYIQKILKANVSSPQQAQEAELQQ